MVTSRPFVAGALAGLLATLAPIVAPVPAPVAEAAPSPGPVTVPVPLTSRPDVLAAFGVDLAAFRAEAATALSQTTTERYGPLTKEVSTRLGRSSWFRPQDVDLYAMPTPRSPEDRPGTSRWAVAAVPRGSSVSPDGSVAPPAAVPRSLGAPRPDGSPDPSFSATWGDEQYFTWAYYVVDDGGLWCPTTKGRLRGQWEYARLENVKAGSPYDYWGFAQRAVADITKEAKACDDAIRWFTAQMQLRAPSAYAVSQDPRTGPDGNCVTTTFTAKGTFSGVKASVSTQAQKCERWKVDGALAPAAAEWYGVTYDHRGVWNKMQRESAAVQIVRVPRGTHHGLNTKLDLRVANRRSPG